MKRQISPNSESRNVEVDSGVKAEIVWILLKHGADVTPRGGTHSTPLHLAMSMGSPEIVQLLVKHGADVNALDGNRKMPLQLVLAAVSVSVKIG